jgi:hypothetical protein
MFLLKVGALCVGIFSVNAPVILPKGGLTRGQSGLIKGGGFRLLGVQCLAVVSVSLWSGITTWMLLAAIDKIVPIRMCIEEEIIGADLWMHDIKHDNYDFDSIITEMSREGLDLCDHIKRSVENRTALGFNLFIAQKFLIEEKKNHWWRRLKKRNSIENFENEANSQKSISRISARIAWINTEPEVRRIRY